MKKQVYHIQTLLIDELDQYKEKEDEQVKEHIKIIQAYQNTYKEALQPIDIDKGKQTFLEGVVQDEEVFLYKLYDVLSKSNRLKTPEPVFI